MKLNIDRINPNMINHFRIVFTFIIVFGYAYLTSSIEAPTQTAMLLTFMSASFGLLSIALFYKSLQVSEISKLNVLRSIDPFVVLIVSFIVLNEILTVKQLTGGIVMFLGIIVIVFSRHRPKLIDRWLT